MSDTVTVAGAFSTNRNSVVGGLPPSSAPLPRLGQPQSLVLPACRHWEDRRRLSASVVGASSLAGTAAVNTGASNLAGTVKIGGGFGAAGVSVTDDGGLSMDSTIIVGVTDSVVGASTAAGAASATGASSLPGTAQLEVTMERRRYRY